MTTLRTPYWTHKPKLIPEYVFEPLLDVMTEYCEKSTSQKRKSCVFLNKGVETNYKYIPSYDISDSPTILTEIWALTEQYTNEKYDYVLVHIYPTGKASIGWHNDSEAMESSIASISLGATRKFRLKGIDKKTGWDNEIYLHNGDLMWMHGPDKLTGRVSCQHVYLHTVPIESTIKESRINLTFRQYIPN